MYTTKNISQLGGRLMKAMYINAPGQVEFRDIDKPVRQKGEVLLKLLYGGICGSMGSNPFPSYTRSSGMVIYS